MYIINYYDISNFPAGNLLTDFADHLNNFVNLWESVVVKKT